MTSPSRDLNTFDQAERNNVTAEARIFHRLKRFLNLILGDRHRDREVTARAPRVKIDRHRKRYTV